MEIDREDERVDFIVEMLIANKALELKSLDEDGNEVYRLTPECEELFPEFYQAHEQYVNALVSDLWQLGIVEIRFEGDTSRETLVGISEYGYKKYLEIRNTLEQEHIQIVENLLGETPRRTLND